MASRLAEIADSIHVTLAVDIGSSAAVHAALREAITALREAAQENERLKSKIESMHKDRFFRQGGTGVA